MNRHPHVKDRSEAFIYSPCPHGSPNDTCTLCALRDAALADGYDKGLEDMRSACMEAIQRVAQTLALGPAEVGMFKAAIEGIVL